MKPGKVVVMLSGRYAGCKAVVLKVHESSDDRKAKGAKARNTLIVCGLSSPPKAVTKKTLKANLKLEGEKKTAADKAVAKRQRVKTFVKQVNFTHVMPTRYNVDLHEDLSMHVASDKALEGAEERQQLRKTLKDILDQKYAALGSMADAKVQKHTMFFFKCVCRRAEPGLLHAARPPVLTPLSPFTPAPLSQHLQEASFLNEHSYYYKKNQSKIPCHIPS